MRPSGHLAAQTVVIVFSLLLGGCDGAVRVKGIVQDSSGNPVGTARVHLTDMDLYWRTESRLDGCFAAGGTTSPWHKDEPLTVEIAGYKSASARVPAGFIENQVIVTVAPVASGTKSQIQLLPEGSKEIMRCDRLK